MLQSKLGNYYELALPFASYPPTPPTLFSLSNSKSDSDSGSESVSESTNH